MANTAAKKIKKQNEAMLRRAGLLLVAFAVVYLLVRFVWFWSTVRTGHWFGLVGLLAANAGGFYLLKLSAVVKYGADGDIEDPGADLNSPGLISYYWDMLYVAWFVQVTTLYSELFWLAILVIPIFGGYLVWTQMIGPYLSMMNQSKATAAEDPKARKKREKAEKKQTVKFMSRR